jgi:glucose/arabinose dehydrogenase
MNKLAPARIATLVLATVVLTFVASGDAEAKKKKDKAPKEDPYAEYVWPPPPDEPRIKLELIITGRADVEAPSGLKRTLLGASPQSGYDRLRKPFGVAFDSEGRILVTDSGTGALIRFDRKEGRMDVFGTTGAMPLKLPMGLDVGANGTIHVADAQLGRVISYDPDGKLLAAYGRDEDLQNPTDVVESPDGKRLFVADSKAHRIVVFESGKAASVSRFGERGEDEGQFSFPTSLAFGPEGNLFVVDQMNSRVQVFSPDGDFIDTFGSLGVGFANFVRPKDVAVDETGIIYVTDNAFNNVQLFDIDFTLLTFVGEAGLEPGRFQGASGVAARGREFAVVDQLGRRVQVFRFLIPND